MRGRTCGWVSRAAIAISRRNRSAPITAATSGRSTLIATWRLCRRSSATYTVAMPPRPRTRSILWRSPRAAERASRTRSMEESYRDGKPNAPYPGERAPLRGLRSAESLRPMLGRLAFAGLLVPTTLVAQGTPCVSRRSGSVPAAYAATVARERMLVCERLATRIPGVQVAVAVNGKLVWSEGFGYADAARKRPVTHETQFRIGSVSKPLTEFFLNRRFATVLDGLTIFQDDSLLFPPGTRFSYSSYGWNLVAAVVEGASGDDFLHYMSTHVFRPKSVSGPRQCTDTCRVAGSPADPSRTARQDELRRAPRAVDGDDAGARSSCAATAPAPAGPPKRQSHPLGSDRGTSSNRRPPATPTAESQ